jgi:hypothetical protein
MDSEKSAKFDVESLNALGTRLFDHAGSITNVGAREMKQDIRLAASVCHSFAGPRFRLAAITELALIEAPAPHDATCSMPWRIRNAAVAS